MGHSIPRPRLAAARSSSEGVRRRRAPSQAEQKRREQWGQTWGKILSATAKHLREERH